MIPNSPQITPLRNFWLREMLAQGQKEQARVAKRTATIGPSDMLGENIDVDILTKRSVSTDYTLPAQGP